MQQISRPSKAAVIIRIITLTIAVAAIIYAISDHPYYGGEPGFGGTQKAIVTFGVILALCVFIPLEWNSKILIFCLSGLFMLAFAEIAVKQFLEHKIRTSFQQSDKLIFELKPGARSEFRHLPINGGNSVIQSINSSGFRGDELDTEIEKFRVIVYGDSFIHAAYSPKEETFTVRLRVQLEQKLGTAVETINAGVSSYGPDQISIKLERELPQLKPDLVIVSIFAGNDYGDLLRNKLFKLDKSGNLQNNSYKLSEKIRTGFYLSHRESVLKQAIRKLIPDEESSALAEIFNDTQALMAYSLDIAKKEYEDFVVNGSSLVTNTHTDFYSADVSLEPNSESARYRIKFMEAIMARISQIANNNHVPLVFMFIPHPLNVAKSYYGGNIDTKKYPQYKKNNLVRPLEDAANRIGVPYLSLFETFSQRNANELYFRGGDDHWNSMGQQVAAETMAEYLLSHRILSSKQ